MTDLALPRRKLLQAGLYGAAGLLVPSGLALACDPTPQQTEGPFHPIQTRRLSTGQVVRVDQRLRRWEDRDADLTFVDDRPGHAYGQVLEVHARVVTADDDCAAIEGADVEVWQACVTGRYNHRSDPSTEWLDPNFQYWGKARSDAQGNVLFRTVVPGAYAAGGGWIRPPHIHVKAAAAGHRALTSQWYFEGVSFYYGNRNYDQNALRSLNQRDQVLGAVPEEQRRDVVAAVQRLGPPTARTLRASYTLRLSPSASA